jgi:hypothetical protein
LICGHESDRWEWRHTVQGRPYLQQWCGLCGALHDGLCWTLPKLRNGGTLEMDGEHYDASVVRRGVMIAVACAFSMGSIAGFLGGLLIRH